MLRSQITLAQAAELLGISPQDLRSMAVQGEIPANRRGDSFVFFQDDVDMYLSEHIICNDGAWEARQDEEDFAGISLAKLCPVDCISCDLKGNSRTSIIRALTELADRSGFLYDPEDLRAEITRREEAGSTNIGCGIAIPHTLVREDGYFSESFVCIARLAKPMYFNSAPDGSITELLILSCSADSAEHLAILGRISNLCRYTNFLQDVREAETSQEIYEALVNAENLLKSNARKRR